MSFLCLKGGDNIYRFSLSYDNDLSNIIYFPLTIEEFKTTLKTLNKTVDVVNGEQMTIIKSIPLREFSLKVLLPRDDALVKDSQIWKEPIVYLARLREFKANKKPLRFIVLRPQEDGTELFGGNLLVTLEEYIVNEKAGEEGDFYVDIKLKEYKTIQGKKIIIAQNKTNENGKVQAKEEPQRQTKEPSKTYTVKKGDTLWAIAQKQLGNGSKWQDIAKLNNISNPNSLQVGQVLKLQ